MAFFPRDLPKDNIESETNSLKFNEKEKEAFKNTEDDKKEEKTVLTTLISDTKALAKNPLYVVSKLLYYTFEL